MAKVRVYELAKDLGMESKDVLAKLQEMGEFVRSASSTVEPPVVRRLLEKYPPVAKPVEEKKPAAKKAPAKKSAAKKVAEPSENPSDVASGSAAEPIIESKPPVTPAPTQTQTPTKIGRAHV